MKVKSHVQVLMIWPSQAGEADDGCTAMTMKKHNAVWGDPSDNDASVLDNNYVEEELSIEFPEAHCQRTRRFL